MKMPHWLKNLFCLFVLLALCWAVGFIWFTQLIPAATTEDGATADAIVVFTGSSGRLERGFELLIAGRAPRMFISGVEDGVTLASLLRKKEYQPFTSRIPESDVELGYKAHTTIGNATETAVWAAHEHVKSLLLVTGNYHMPRSVFEMHIAMPDITIIPAPVFTGHFVNNEWWRHADSIRLVISEYNKYITSHIVSLLDA